MAADMQEILHLQVVLVEKCTTGMPGQIEKQSKLLSGYKDSQKKRLKIKLIFQGVLVRISKIFK